MLAAFSVAAFFCFLATMLTPFPCSIELQPARVDDDPAGSDRSAQLTAVRGRPVRVIGGRDLARRRQRKLGITKLWIMVREQPVTAAVEDYAKAIYELELREGRAQTNALAERIGVSAPSVSGMVKRLAELGLVSYSRYRGARLTKKGRRLALEVIRHHRLLELFLVEEFGMSWDQVHAEAEALEHVLSEQVEERIAARLGDPVVDPHGDPIPTVTLEIEERATRSLQSLEPGERGVFTRVSDSPTRRATSRSSSTRSANATTSASTPRRAVTAAVAAASTSRPRSTAACQAASAATSSPSSPDSPPTTSPG